MKANILQYVLIILISSAAQAKDDLKLKGLMQLDLGDSSELYDNDSRSHVDGIGLRRMRLTAKKKMGAKFKSRVSLELDDDGLVRLDKAFMRYKISSDWKLYLGLQPNVLSLSHDISSADQPALERSNALKSIRKPTLNAKIIGLMGSYRLSFAVFSEETKVREAKQRSIGLWSRITWHEQISEQVLLHFGTAYQDDDASTRQSIRLSPRSNEVFFNLNKNESLASRDQISTAEALLLWRGLTLIIEGFQRRLVQAQDPDSSYFDSYNGTIHNYSGTLSYNLSHRMKPYDRKNHVLKGQFQQKNSLSWELFMSYEKSALTLGELAQVNEYQYSGGLSLGLSKKIHVSILQQTARSWGTYYGTSSRNDGTANILRMQWVW